MEVYKDGAYILLFLLTVLFCAKAYATHTGKEEAAKKYSKDFKRLLVIENLFLASVCLFCLLLFLL